MATPQSLAVVPRVVRSELERRLRIVLGRLPPRVQRMSTAAIGSLTKRWPILSRLVRVAAPPPYREPITSEIRSTVTEEALIQNLRNPSAEVAAGAAEALREYPSNGAIAALFEAVENREGYFSPLTRASAVHTLGALLPVGQGDPIATAVSSVDAEVSLAAIAALVERDDPKSVETLLDVLEDRRGFYLPVTRQAAARGLLRLEIPQDARLKKLFDDEMDEVVRGSLVPLFPWLAPR